MKIVSVFECVCVFLGMYVSICVCICVYLYLCVPIIKFVPLADKPNEPKSANVKILRNPYFKYIVLSCIISYLYLSPV